MYLCALSPPFSFSYCLFAITILSGSLTWSQISTICGAGRWRNTSGLGLYPGQTLSSCSQSASLASPTLRDFSSIPTSDSVRDCQLCPSGTYKSSRLVPYPIQFYPIVSHPILSNRSYPIISFRIPSYSILSYPIQSILSHLSLSYPILSHLILSYPISSYPILSYLILSYRISS